MDRTRNEPRTPDSAEEPKDDSSKPEPRRHDQTYKGIFVRSLATRSLVCDFLAFEWHPVLDLATIKFIRAESIGPGRRRRLPDFAVQVWFKDSEDSVVFLVEFQSSHDPSMALRTCDYAPTPTCSTPLAPRFSSSPACSTQAPSPGTPRPA